MQYLDFLLQQTHGCIHRGSLVVACFLSQGPELCELSFVAAGHTLGRERDLKIST